MLSCRLNRNCPISLVYGRIVVSRNSCSSFTRLGGEFIFFIKSRAFLYTKAYKYWNMLRFEFLYGEKRYLNLDFFFTVPSWKIGKMKLQKKNIHSLLIISLQACFKLLCCRCCCCCSRCFTMMCGSVIHSFTIIEFANLLRAI